MEALSGQNLPPGFINYVIGLCGHPAAAYRAKEKLKKGIDFKESYAGTARWNTVILVVILAVFYDFPLYLIDIVAFFLHGRLAPGEQIYMEALPGQNLPPGFINYEIGSLYSVVTQLRLTGRRRSSMRP